MAEVNSQKADQKLNPSDPDSAINFLISQANLERKKHQIVLNSGALFEFWSTPLTAGDRLRATANAKTTDNNEILILLLVEKATYENGQPMFHVGHVPELKRRIRESDLNKLELAILADEEAEVDPKP